MENPYWHDNFKPHLIDRDEIRQLCFEIYSIVMCSVGKQGAGDDNDEDREPTILDELFFSKAEAELSKRLLKLALLVRTFDDTMTRNEDNYQTFRITVDKTSGPFGAVLEGSDDITHSIRECSNKIIHAEDVRLVYDSDDERTDPLAMWGMNGSIELQGIQGKREWSITVILHPYLEDILGSLGREIGTPAGPIDNLFLSSDGYIVLVETKLWRNPEARRMVIAQILDYAAHVRRWTYEKVEELWRRRHGDAGLWPEFAQDEPEQDWIDKVSRNLSEGRMTLLVVGDGIRSQSLDLADTVAGHPDFPFRLALVELRMYELDSERIVIVPDTLFKTHEIERAVVRIIYSGPNPPSVQVDVPKISTTTGKSGGSLSAEAFLSELTAKGPDGKLAAETAERLLGFLDAADLQVDWGAGGFIVRAMDPVRLGEYLTLATATRNGMILYAYQPWIRGPIERSVGPAVAEKAVTALTDFFLRWGGKPTKSGVQINIPLTRLHGQEKAFAHGLVDLSETIGRLLVVAADE